MELFTSKIIVRTITPCLSIKSEDVHVSLQTCFPPTYTMAVKVMSNLDTEICL